MLDKIESLFNKVVNIVGKITSVLLLLMIFNVFYDVIMRYFFRNSSVGMQEMEWHLFSVIILFGVSVALKDEGHVRVDFLYEKFSIRRKAVINIIGTIFFLLPLALLIATGSIGFVMDSYTINEISEDPGGLTHRWIIKAMIPLSFIFLIFCAVGYVIKNINLYRGAEKQGGAQ
ncbi:MAG: TRAP transporter small permease subunit [Desulfopila sp.]|jgi:TRAP-type mannitol/chloroaromatic compound transport system permease small subunit|nr:TRAP transporter small permease subunit [Desulfopila sp.]